MNNFDRLMSGRPEGMKAWIHKPETKAFFQYLEDERLSLIENVENTNESNEIFCLKGELRRLHKLLNLRSIVENYKTGGK